MEDEILNMILTLQQRQKNMLNGKQNALLEMFSMCSDCQTRQLVYDLILNFAEMDDDIYNLALMDISNHIMQKGYDDNEIGILAMAKDKDPDSSQEVVQNLKLTLGLVNHPNITIRNSFNYRNELIRKAKKKCIIVVDDFIGSGKTCRLRHKTLKSEFKDCKDLEISFCFIAGMQDAINALKTEGIDIYCSYIMKKGISEFYAEEEKSSRILQMNNLEKELAPQINDTLLSEHSFGYGKSEALFCRRNRNIPNNTFPVFWWKEYANGDKRNTLYNRIQNGY